MKLVIETPDFKPSPSLKEFIKTKINKLEKLYPGIQSIETTLEKESLKTKEIIKCSINIRIPGRDEYVKSSAAIFEDAIMKAVDNAKRRLSIRKTQLLAARRKRVKEKGK